MQIVSSAMAAPSELRSASECTSTVRIPSSRQARMTRTAISPRLAMRTFLNATNFFHRVRQRDATLDGRRAPRTPGGTWMPDSVYRVTQVIGTSTENWEAAARNAVETAARTVRDLRVAEVDRLDVTIENGRVTTYRARVNISFKYGSGE